jgi:hypothetical protein
MGVAEEVVDLLALERTGARARQERRLTLDVLAGFGDEEVEKISGFQSRPPETRS